MKEKPYLGSKGAAGTMQVIINHMPAHDVYIEPFVGSGIIVKNKHPSFSTIINDLDSQQAHKVFNEIVKSVKHLEVYSKDAVDVLERVVPRDVYTDNEVFIYCDPPYLLSTRTGRSRYKHEMTDDDHVLLLDYLVDCDANIMLSGYPNALYDNLLSDWQSVEFQAMTRGGVRTEKLWMNYDISTMELHQTNFIGKNFGDRQRIKRKVNRLSRKINNLPRHEKQAIMEVLNCGTS